MNEEQQKRSDSSPGKKRPVNGWKWAFLILTGILAGVLIWLTVQLTAAPKSSPHKEMENAVEGETIRLEVRSEKEELEVLANQFLKQESKDDSVEYELFLRDQARLAGKLQLFGIPVPFELDLMPYVMENGNLQLKATGISLGNLKLPIAFVMSQIEKQLPLPDWVSVHSDAQYLIVHLDQFKLKSGIHFSMEQVDLEQNDIRVNVFIPKDDVPETD